VLLPAPDEQTSNDVPNLADSVLAGFVPCFSQKEIRTILDSAQHPSDIDAFVNTLGAGSMEDINRPYPPVSKEWVDGTMQSLSQGTFCASLFCRMVSLIFWES
jgi:hypothetical protein